MYRFQLHGRSSASSSATLWQAMILACVASAMSWQTSLAAADDPPNLVIIFADDLGYNDLACFGAPKINTLHIDRMAAEGRRFTDFYVGGCTCTPSRAALMTGCYPVRVGFDDSIALNARGKLSPGRVLHPNAPYGLPSGETTIAELLREAGYRTGMVGKWHLGDAPEFNPVHHGFDEFFGVPYSNDMEPYYYLRGAERLDESIDRDRQIRRFTDEATKFIKENQERPFFLYYAHAMPHTPLAASEEFRGQSKRGDYGDSVAEIDWSVGEIMQVLRDLDLDSRTLVVFTSDNGPWLARGKNGGSAYPFRAGKGTTYEGGMRVPCVMWQPGTVPADTECHEIATTLDFLPSFARLAGAELPSDRVIDGKDIVPLIHGDPGATSPWEYFYYYFGNELHGVRSGKWKLRAENHVLNEDLYKFRRVPNAAETSVPEQLFDLQHDPSEQKSVIKNHPKVARRLRAALDRARDDLGDALTGVEPTNARPVGSVSDDQ